MISLPEAEVYRHPETAPGYGGVLAAIVQRVRDNDDHHSWIAAHSPRTHVTDELPFAAEMGPQRTRAAQKGAVSPAGCRSVPGDRQWIRPHLRVRAIARLRVHSVTGSHLKEKPFALPTPDLVGIVDERSA